MGGFTTNNNEVLLFRLLFGPRFIRWVGGWFRRNPTNLIFSIEKQRQSLEGTLVLKNLQVVLGPGGGL